MTIPHVIEWHEGAPEKLEAGMFIIWDDGNYSLIGHIDQEFSTESQIAEDEDLLNRVGRCIVRWACFVSDHEMTWAADMSSRRNALMAKRHLAK